MKRLKFASKLLLCWLFLNYIYACWLFGTVNPITLFEKALTAFMCIVNGGF